VRRSPLCRIAFTLTPVFSYWSIGLHPGAGHFFRFLGVLFLAVYTAESQVCIAVSFPVRLLIAVFSVVGSCGSAPHLRGVARRSKLFERLLDGEHCMSIIICRCSDPLQCVQGYFIRAVNLPTFWRVWAHWIDYQTYAFEVLVNNDFRKAVYSCTVIGSECHCAYPSSLIEAGECALKGEDVLKSLDIGGISMPLYASILLLIALFFRVALYVVLVFKKR